MVKIHHILFLLFFLSSSLLFSQDYIADVQYYGVEQGLSHREVYCTYQDKNGFIWLGTKYGLNRFDGKEFILYTKEKDGLLSNEIHQIFQDGEGWLWLISVKRPLESTAVKQISLLNPETREIRTLAAHFGKNLPFKANDIYHIGINEANKNIILGSKNEKIFLYDRGKKFQVIEKKGWKEIYSWFQSMTHTIIVETFAKDNAATVYEITKTGEVLHSWESTRLFFLDADSSNNILAYFKPQTFSSIPSQDLNMSIVSFKSNSQPKQAPFLIKPSKDTLKVDDWNTKLYLKKSDQTFWYKSEARFFVFDQQGNLLFDFNLENPEISKSVIQDIYFDPSGRAWIATTQGFYFIRLINNPFRRFLYNPSSIYDINEFISCRDIQVQGDSLWICTEIQSTYQINLKTSAVNKLPKFKFFINKKIPSSSEGRVIIPRKDGNLLFGETELFDYQISDGTIQLIPWPDTVLNDIWSINKDQNEIFWIGTYDRPLGFWKEGMESIQFYQKMNDFEFPIGTFIYSFLELDKHNILIGSSAGIYLLNHENGITKRYWTEGKEDAYFPNDNVFHLVKDKKEERVIWVATGGGGILRWTLDDEQTDNRQPANSNQQPTTPFQQFTIANGLSSNTIYAVYEDEFENLWLPSDYGIIQFDKSTHFSKAYLEKDGITNNEFNRISHHQDASGNLYFGGLNGLTVFHPNDLSNGKDTLDVPLRITEFQQYDAQVDDMVDKTAEILTTHQIKLLPGDRFFNLKFALLEFQNSERIRYAYQIEGQDKGWNIISDNSLRISGLNYGNYTLRIKGQGSNGQFSRQELSIPIVVIKPFYLENWFIFLSIISFLVLAYFFYKYQTNQYKRQQALLEKKVQERTETIEKQKEELQNLDKVKSRFFANVSHELRTPLTLMLGPLSSMLKDEQISNKTFTFGKLIQNNTQNLLRLVNEILDLTKLEAGKLEVKETATPLYSFIGRLVAAFESHAQRQGIQFEFHFNVDQYLQVLIDRNKFEKIINNLLSNALKFTPPDGNIKVEITDSAKGLLLKVQDNGRGIHQNDLHLIFDRYYQSQQANAPTEGGTGIGLALCKEFSKLMKGNIWVESSLGSGSTFFFEFPKKEILGAPAEIAFERDKKRFNQAEIIFENTAVTNEKATSSTILVVEDNHNLRNYLKLILSEKYKVITAENGKIAWEFLTANGDGLTEDGQTDQTDRPPSLIISDIMMPEMDGYQLLEKLKGNEHLRQLPVIMLTARAEIKDKLKALRIGVDDYMLKPFEEKELMARIENLLKNRQERLSLSSKIEKESSKNDIAIIETENQKSISKRDLKWLEELENIVFTKLSNFDFDVQYLANEIALSNRQLSRRIQSLTGLTASKYIQEARLNKAREYLENQTIGSVKAIAYEVGFNDEKYFGQKYKERFGKLPSAYF